MLQVIIKGLLEQIIIENLILISVIILVVLGLVVLVIKSANSKKIKNPLTNELRDKLYLLRTQVLVNFHAKDLTFAYN